VVEVRTALLLALAASGAAQSYLISTAVGGAAPPTPIAGLSAAIGEPLGVTTGSSEDVYFTSLGCVFKLDAKGILTQVAGNARAGYSGEGDLAIAAPLNQPAGLALDRSGSIYIADTNNYRVRRVSATGIITTVAGTGTFGYSGDGGPATSAQISRPYGIAIDGAGNLYIADYDNHRIRRVSTGGVITTVAGKGTGGFSGDGGLATSALLWFPHGVSVDDSGTLYIADLYNNRIRKVSPAGIISTLAGTGSSGFSGDGGPATNAQLAYPYSAAVDGAGNVYIADRQNHRIRRVSPAGMITTVAGKGTGSDSGSDGGPATSAILNFPSDVALDAAGNIYIPDGTLRIRKVSTSGMITTVAGNGLQYSGDGGPAASAQLFNPYGVAADATGNFYIADSRNYRIRGVSPDGMITTIAGTGVIGFSGDSGPATSARLAGPKGLAVDQSGNLYFADGSSRVRKVSPGGIITTVAGGGSYSGTGDGGPAVNARLTGAAGVAVDGAGNLYITDSLEYRVRKVSPNGTISTLAGTGIAGFSGDGGPAASAQLSHPAGIAVDEAGNVFIADSANYRIRKVSPDGIITTVAGTGTSSLSGDGGPATSAPLVGPSDVAVDRSGNLYIVDYRRIRKVSGDGIITTLAGTGSYAYSGDGGLAANATFLAPQNVALDGSGNIYITDTQANAVRVLQAAVPVALAVLTTTPLPPGTVGVVYSQKLNATGGTSPYSWSVTHGALPAGLVLSATGILAGTPTSTDAYKFTVQVRDVASAAASRDFQLVINSQPVSTPTITAGGIVNAATNAAGPITAGSLVSIYGTNLADSSMQAGSIPLPTILNGVMVTFNGVPAPLVFVAPGQINAQVPWDVLPGEPQTGNAVVVVNRAGMLSAPVTVALGPFSPGIFALNFGTGNAIAINGDGSLAAPSGSIPGVATRPTMPGDPQGLIILANGLGALDSYPANGRNSADRLRKTQTTPDVLVGGKLASVAFSGASPQFVGVNQINISIPEGAPTGEKMALQLRLGGITTTDRVTIAVSQCCDQITMAPADGLNVTGQASHIDVTSYTKTYTLQNAQAAAVSYTVAASADWVTLSKTAGTLGPGGKDSFTISLNSNINSLAAGSYTATISVTLSGSTYGTITRTVSLNLSSTACMNIAGQWLTSETGTLACTVTVGGESDTETDPISGSDIITISQQGCDVSYTSASIMSAFGSGKTLRQGIVEGSNVSFLGIMGELAAGFTYQKNVVTLSGSVGSNVINLTGSGSLLASGIWVGQSTTFSCTANTKATMTKW
jgi:uncharacterized protein (TIGR03437 family)